MYPLPNSFSFLTAGAESSFQIAALLQRSLYPYPALPNAGLDWNNSLTNWVSHNNNYTQWMFHVAPGLKWSDGSAVTAQDILNTYSSQYGLNASYDFIGLHTEVSSSFALNSSTAVFNLNKSDAHFPEKASALVYITVQPPKAIAEGAGSNLYDVGVTSTPFYPSTYVSGSPELVLHRNPYFSPTPNICEVDINFVESNTAASQFLVSGSTDLAGPIDPSNIPAILKNTAIHLYDKKGGQIAPLEYNVTEYPYNMTAFRQALAYAINDTAIVNQAFGGYAVPGYNATGTVPSWAPQYNPNIKQYSYDPNQALSLLSSIGIKKGSDGHLQYPNGTDVSTTIWTDNQFTYDSTVATLIATDLQNIGMVANTQVVSTSNLIGYYGSNTNGIRNQMVIFSDSGPVFPDTWLDGQPGWSVYEVYGIPNIHWEYPPNIDALYQGNLTALDSTADPQAEQTYLNNIQAMNAQYLPVIPVVYPDIVWAYNTAHWTNWPAHIFDTIGNYANFTGFAELQPTASAATSGSAITTSTLLIIGVAVVVVVAAVVISIIFLRRRP